MSTRLLGLEFKSNNIIKSKAMKIIVKKMVVNWNYKKQVSVVSCAGC